MTLFDKISEDIKQAMLDKNKVALDALRGVKKEFLEAKTAKGSDGELHDDKALQILQKMVKQRKESAQMYLDANRPELADDELAQCKVIEQYLPEMLSEEELTQVLTAIIQQLAGKAEGKAINMKVRELLSK